ncbi:MAG: isopenicillin N synthase family oxygenase [Maricaulaceae bacterium]|nr:isopenicillin N synthase family oxygenase [Maricaulaceae bacterium]
MTQTAQAAPAPGIAPVSLTLNAHDPQAFANALGRSFREYGFAVVADHGLDQAVIDRAIACARAFFALPEDVKRRYFIPGGGGQRGYTPFGVETAKDAAYKDLKEFWHVGRELAGDHPYRRWMPANLTPAEVEGWDAAYALYEALDGLGHVLLAAIARHLDLPEDYFEDSVRDGNSVLRLLHYPPQDNVPEGSIRAAAHEDINTITLLLGAEEAGLQVKHRDGRWIDINPPPGCLVVNIGDMLQRASNHVLPSTTHRVVNPAPERARHSRYSTPFFLHYRPDFLIETIPGCAGPDNPDRYPQPITAQDYLMQRLREIKLV